MVVHVLRLGHRPTRDKRVTTHLFLAARAFGASGATYTGVKDPSLEETVNDVVINWGGQFSIEFNDDWRESISRWKRGGKVVHLTMYGLPLQRVIPDIRDDASDILVVVGGKKVPGEIYGMANWNVAVTSQPHSEVSALAVFLHELFEGREFENVFEDSRLRVVPQDRGKKVKELSSRV